MRKLGITALIICLAALAQAQTARIAHRSHSGAHKAFNAKSGDHFGLQHPGNRVVDIQHLKLRAADTVKVIKVKPWRQVKDSLPAATPPVNPIYTRSKPAKNKPGTAKSK